MSSCRASKSTRTALGLATLAAVQTSIQARSASSNIRSRLPVRSQHFISSVSTVAVPVQSATPSVSRRPIVPTTVPAPSMPKKTADSILKHVERLRKTRAATSTYKVASAFATTKPAALPPARPRPVPVSRPTSVPSSRVPSTSSASSSRTERSIDTHIERVTRARGKPSPTTSARPSPVSSRKVSPIQPLKIAKKTTSVDLAVVDDRLARLSVAPLVVVKKVSKKVRFIEYGGWNIHGIKAFELDAPPNVFLPLNEAKLLEPTQRGRTKGPVYRGDYSLVGGNREIRWPPPDHDGPIVEGSTTAPSSCRSCAKVAARGTALVRYRPQNQSIRCNDCMSDPDRRRYYVPALDDDGEDDYQDTCTGPHTDSDDCGYLLNGFAANSRWRDEHFRDR